MMYPMLATLALRARLALARANPLTAGAATLLLAVAGSLAWTHQAVRTLEAARDARHARAALAARIAAARPAVVRTAFTEQAVADTPPDNLAAFYDALGERDTAEEQVKTLFALAAQNGLTLAQGEYKAGYDRAARVHTYQINLPVKGGYAAIWRFAFGALRTVPFAALDDIGFRRDGIGDTQVEARLRLTLYLNDRAGSGGAP